MSTGPSDFGGFDFTHTGSRRDSTNEPAVFNFDEEETPYDKKKKFQETLGTKTVSVDQKLKDVVVLQPGSKRQVKQVFKKSRIAVELVALAFRTGMPVTPESLTELNDRDFPIELARAMFESVEFNEALVARGVVTKALVRKDGTMQRPGVNINELSGRQIMVINQLTDYTDKRSIRVKLTSLGVQWWEFQQWQAFPAFSVAYKALGEQLFQDAQAAVNAALTSAAVDGDIPAIKLFNEMSGRHDPTRRQVMDVRAVLNGVVEILNSSIKDPELLATIGGKLAALAGSSGAVTSSQQPNQLEQ